MKIVVFGDCMPVGYAEDKSIIRYPVLLEEYYGKIGSSVIVDCYSGETSQKAVEMLCNVINVNPDFVIIHWGINDGLPRGLGRKQRGNFIKMMYFLKLGKNVRGFLRYVFLNPTEWFLLKVRKPKFYVDVGETANNFTNIISQLKSKTSAKIIVVTPNAVENFRFINCKETLKDYIDAIKKICGEEGVSIIDTYSEFLDYGLNKVLARDKFHLNSVGHRIIADKIIKIINL